MMGEFDFAGFGHLLKTDIDMEERKEQGRMGYMGWKQIRSDGNGLYLPCLYLAWG